MAPRPLVLSLSSVALISLLAAPACRDEPPGPSWFYLTMQNSGLPSDTVYGIYVAGGAAWYATDAGIAYNRAGEWKIYDYETYGLPTDNVYDVLVAPGGDVWAATSVGVVRLRDGGNGAMDFYTVNDGLPANRVVAVTYDGAKVWFATEGGLARFDGPGFTAFTVNDGLPGDDVRDVYAVGVEQVWVACIGGAAFYDHGQLVEYTPLSAGLPSANVYAVAARGAVAWLGTDRGLCRLRDGSLEKVYTAGNSGLKADIINALAYGAGGELWLGTAGGGAARGVGDGFETFDEPRGLLDNYVLSVFGDKLGYIWLGTLSGGVSRYYD